MKNALVVKSIGPSQESSNGGCVTSQMDDFTVSELCEQTGERLRSIG